jgi:shikimate kinase
LAPTVILIGFMGSGKTVAGRVLASSLGWEFVDADAVVEDQMGLSIPEAFSSRGEVYFRQIEEEVVLRLIEEAGSSDNGVVLSLGGGAVTSRSVRELLERQPIVVLLTADIETAFERAGGGSRPLAKERAAFRDLFEERSYLYRQAAGFTVDTSDKDPNVVASEIAAIVRDVTRE